MIANAELVDSDALMKAMMLAVWVMQFLTEYNLPKCTLFILYGWRKTFPRGVSIYHNILLHWVYSNIYTVFTKMWIQAVGHIVIIGAAWIMLLVSDYSSLTQFKWNGLRGRHLGACSETESYRCLLDTVKSDSIIIIWYELEGWVIRMVVTGEWKILGALAFERSGFKFSFCHYLMPCLQKFRKTVHI